MESNEKTSGIELKPLIASFENMNSSKPRGILKDPTETKHRILRNELPDKRRNLPSYHKSLQSPRNNEETGNILQRPTLMDHLNCTLDNSENISRLGGEVSSLKKQIKKLNADLNQIKAENSAIQVNQAKELNKLKDILINLIYEKEKQSETHENRERHSRRRGKSRGRRRDESTRGIPIARRDSDQRVQFKSAPSSLKSSRNTSFYDSRDSSKQVSPLYSPRASHHAESASNSFSPGISRNNSSRDGNLMEDELYRPEKEDNSYTKDYFEEANTFFGLSMEQNKDKDVFI